MNKEFEDENYLFVCKKEDGEEERFCLCFLRFWYFVVVSLMVMVRFLFVFVCMGNGVCVF